MSSLHQLIKEISVILKKNNWQIVTAESCTGGLIAGCLTEISGSSAWFERGFITYSNLAKIQMLSVARHLIDEYGAVSEPVATAMALGALQNSTAQVAVAVTGIAGPCGGSIEKPVGTVCFAWVAAGMKPMALTQKLAGNRKAIRLAACRNALSGILAYIKNNDTQTDSKCTF